MRRILVPVLTLVGLLLAACGSYAPPAPTRSAVEERQTALALSGRPTLAPLAGSDGSTPTPRPTPRPIAELLSLSADDPRALGDPAAPVLVVEFTDYE